MNRLSSNFPVLSKESNGNPKICWCGRRKEILGICITENGLSAYKSRICIRYRPLFPVLIFKKILFYQF